MVIFLSAIDYLLQIDHKLIKEIPKEPKISKPKKSKSESSESLYFSDHPVNNKQPKKRTNIFNSTEKFNKWSNFDGSLKPFDPKTILTSLASSDNSPPSKYAGKRDKGDFNSHDIFSTLISSSNVQPELEDSDSLDHDSAKTGHFLGETSSAFTSTPIAHPYLSNSSSPSHPKTGIDDSALFEEFDGSVSNPDEKKLVPSEPLDFRAVIIKPRFVTLSWTEPKTTNGEIENYGVIYKVVDSLR